MENECVFYFPYSDIQTEVYGFSWTDYKSKQDFIYLKHSEHGQFL